VEISLRETGGKAVDNRNASLPVTHRFPPLFHRVHRLSNNYYNVVVRLSLDLRGYPIQEGTQIPRFRAVKVERSERACPGDVYLLTPKGVEEKSRLTFSFLKQKTEEYDQIKQKIDQLQQEMFSHYAQRTIDLEW